MEKGKMEKDSIPPEVVELKETITRAMLRVLLPKENGDTFEADTQLDGKWYSMRFGIETFDVFRDILVEVLPKK